MSVTFVTIIAAIDCAGLIEKAYSDALLLTERIFQVLHKRGFLEAILTLNIIGWDVACTVGGIANSPPGLRVIQEPQALVFPDVKFLVLLSSVVPLGYNNHLLCHLSSSPTKSTEEKKRREKDCMRNNDNPK